MMDVSRELELFREEAEPIEAAQSAAQSPTVQTGRLYAVKLHRQDGVQPPAPGTRKPDPALQGGVLRFSVAEAGLFRVAADANFWIDVVFEGAPLEARDFRGNRECNGPRKIVTFQLPAGADLLIQLMDARVPGVRLTVTPVPQKDW